MNTIQKGNVTELRIQTALVEKGYHVFTPITDGSSIDLLFIDETNKAQRVQIKTAIRTATGFSFDTRKATSSSRIRKKYYTEDELDFFATEYEGRVYLIPVKDVSNYSTPTLRIDKSYKNQHNPLHAESYLL